MTTVSKVSMTMTLSSIILKDKFALQMLVIHIETNEQSFETFFFFCVHGQE